MLACRLGVPMRSSRHRQTLGWRLHPQRATKGNAQMGKIPADSGALPGDLHRRGRRIADPVLVFYLRKIQLRIASAWDSLVRSPC
jgi:hypothetical protein